MTMKLTSTAFHQGGTIPKRYTEDGVDVSPELEWTEPPPGTQSFALICEDPDAPRGTYTHWVLFSLPMESRGLKEGIPPDAKLADGSIQGTNDFGKIGYGGPAPPPGKPHRYFFKLFALDAKLPLASGSTKHHLLDSLPGHILAETELVGTYGR